MAGSGYEAAIEKAKVKRAVFVALTSLPMEERRGVLADLLIEMDEPIELTPVKRKPRVVRAPSVDDSSIARAVRRGAKLERYKKASRPRGGRPKGSGASKGDAICAALKSTPQMSIADLAKLVYAGEEDARHKVRAALNALKVKGRVKNMGSGRWEVT